MSRKGQEMSINVLVGIILGIIMLGAAIFIFFKIYANTNETSCEIDQQTQSKIIDALDSGEPIYVPQSTVVTGKDCTTKNGVVFYVGIRNTMDEEVGFNVDITALSPVDFNMSRVAYFNEYPNVPAKGVQMVTVVVNTKGLTQQVSLLINVSHDADDADPGMTQYWKPKIVRIEPK